MRAAGPLRTAYYFDKPVVRLLKELAQRPRPGRVDVEKGALRLTVDGAR